MNRPQYPTILQCIGNTPLVQLQIGLQATILAKLEFLNPGGSVKDRSALFMVEQAEKDGLLKPGGTIVEASSGNQGIALAMIGKIKGYRVIITLPDRTAKEKVAILRCYGAEVHICPNVDDLHDPRGYHTLAERLAQTIPGAFMPNQYFNKANPLAHYTTTGPEIWHQTKGRITHFFCGAGSCGTISGVSRYLKKQKAAIRTIGVDAATSVYSSPCPKAYNAEGIGIDVITDTLDKQYIDEIVPVSDEDAFTMTRRLAQEFGLLVGISSGAVMCALFRAAPQLQPTDTVVVILADSGRSYLSKVFSQDPHSLSTPASQIRMAEMKNGYP